MFPTVAISGNMLSTVMSGEKSSPTFISSGNMFTTVISSGNVFPTIISSGNVFPTIVIYLFNFYLALYLSSVK